MKKILIINSINYRSDPRPKRIYEYLKSNKRYFLKNLLIPRQIDDGVSLSNSLKNLNFLSFLKKLFCLKLNIHNEYYSEIINFLKKKKFIRV